MVSLQVGRGIAALCVVLYHAAGTFADHKYWGTQPFGKLFRPGNSGVYYFFVLSGFIIAYAHDKDIGRPDQLLRYARNRVARIYPVYWLISIVALAAGVVLYHQRFDPLFLLGSFSLVPVQGDHGVLAVAWTLFHEVIFYFFFAGLIVSRRWGSAVLALWGVGCLAGIVFTPASEFLGVVFAPINLLFFVGLGCFAAVRRYRLPAPLAVGVCGVVLFALAWAGEIFWFSEDGLPRIFVFGLACGLIVWSFAEQELRRGLAVPQFFRLLGDASYSIYLTHYLAVSLLAKILVRTRDFVPGWMALLSIIALATFLGVLVYLWIEQPLMRALRKDRRALAA